jgi:uncharacterized protein YndB with AHSA1/START domain
MTEQTLSPSLSLEMRRTYAAAPARVFQAWTRPEELKQWWGAAEGYTTPIAEIDLQVGGSYRLGMRPPGGPHTLVVTGTYEAIVPDEKLVFSWQWETPDDSAPVTQVTVNFIPLESGTEVIVTHSQFPDEAMRDQHDGGWKGLLTRLTHVVEP